MKRVSFIRTITVRLLSLMLCLWLVAMTALTFCLTGDLRHQGATVCSQSLERYMSDLTVSSAEQEAAPLPEIHLVPENPILLLNSGEMKVWKAQMTLSTNGIITETNGFYTGSASGTNLGLTVTEGKLSYIVSSSLMEGTGPVDTYGGLKQPWNQYSGMPPQVYLTFHDAPQRKGSFPSAEFSDSYTDDSLRPNDPTKPATPGEQTPRRLLDGIESGEFHFDSDSILQSSRLRGVWLRNEAGEPLHFVIAAYGWNPLLSAAKMLGGVYLICLALFFLTGLLLCLTVRRTLTKPMTCLSQELASDPLRVTEKEFDFSYRYREVQDITAPYLMRRQMQAASIVLADAPQKEEPGVELVSAYQRAAEKLMPILGDRGQELKREFTADGLIRTTEDQLINALLSLVREAVPYLDQGKVAILRTLEKSGFLLAEMEVQEKRHLDRNKYDLLWEGVYREPADGSAPGALLRRDTADLSGSFCAVRKTKKGIVLTLGLPKMTD